MCKKTSSNNLANNFYFSSEYLHLQYLYGNYYLRFSFTGGFIFHQQLKMKLIIKA